MSSFITYVWWPDGHETEESNPLTVAQTVAHISDMGLYIYPKAIREIQVSGSPNDPSPAHRFVMEGQAMTYWHDGMTKRFEQRLGSAPARSDITYVYTDGTSVHRPNPKDPEAFAGYFRQFVEHANVPGLAEVIVCSAPTSSPSHHFRFDVNGLVTDTTGTSVEVIERLIGKSLPRQTTVIYAMADGSTVETVENGRPEAILAAFLDSQNPREVPANVTEIAIRAGRNNLAIDRIAIKANGSRELVRTKPPVSPNHEIGQ